MDIPLILGRMDHSAKHHSGSGRGFADVAFKQRAVERLHHLCAIDPLRFAPVAESYGALSRVLSILRAALQSLGCAPPPPATAAATTTTQQRKKKNKKGKRSDGASLESASQRDQLSPLDVLLIARPAVGFTAELMLARGATFELADAQATALGATDLAMAALARFPNDNILQRHTCLVLRWRCETDLVRTVGEGITR